MSKSNTVNIAAPGEEGSDDPDSPSDVTDWSTLEPSGIPQSTEDPLTNPKLMDPGTTGARTSTSRWTCEAFG
ncbi:MAG: hypothetical protein M3N18_10005 [Actinomycetota bacterium]|nr:hypothetical protein [Actinomycetota bacterium]